MQPLQRSRSAPHTVASLGMSPNGQKTLARTMSHEQVLKGRAQPYLKPLASTAAGPGSPTEEDDPFSLCGFFPTRLGRDEGWRWLREEAVGEEDEEAGLGAEEEDDLDADEVIKGEDKLGILTLSGDYSYTRTFNDDGQLLSPYRFEDAVDEQWLYESHCRRRKAVREKAPAGSAEYAEALFGGRELSLKLE